MTGSETPVDPERRLATAPPAERAVWRTLRSVEDPELPVSVVDLGLIYGVHLEDDVVEVDLTLTYSGCPARDMIVRDIERAVEELPDVEQVEVSIVYSPRWSYDRITERGRRELQNHGLAVPGGGSDAKAACEEP